MARLMQTTYHSDQFTWVKEAKALVAEASDIHYNSRIRQIIIMSGRTGRTQIFRLHEVLVDHAENEVLGWVFYPAVWHLQGKVSVTIFND